MSSLTALAAVLLLAASGQAAWAQGTVSFSTTTGILKEGVPDAERFRVTVTRSATSVNPVSYVLQVAPAPAAQRANSAWHLFRIDGDRTGAGLSGSTLNFNAQNQATLTIYQNNEIFNNWNSEQLILKLQAPAGTAIGPDLVLKTEDSWERPTLAFTDTTPLRLTEKSRASAHLSVSVPPGTPANRRPSYVDLTRSYCSYAVIQVDPPSAIGRLNAAGAYVADGLLELTTRGTNSLGTNVTSHLVPVDRVGVALNGRGTPIPQVPGRFFVPWHVPDLASQPRELVITARPDTSGFKNQTVTITPVGEVLNPVDNFFQCPDPMITRAGTGFLFSGPPLVIEIISDEPVPTVSFSPTDISIKEGGSTTAALVAEGPQGHEVSAVDIAVDGDALVDLYRGDAKLAPVSGVIKLDLKDTNVARLTARSTSDRSLLDGQMKSKTWRIVDADGANIDADANWFAVTVKGSTAVPALPLVAQLLLALFLAAGGARYHRQRR